MNLRPAPLVAEQWRRQSDLSGEWRFEIGDNMQFADPDFDDSHWEWIRVPGAWENQGFPGYDGFAWYRTSFVTPPEANEHLLYMQLGYIDDVDEVYVNGKLIGYQGQFPPAYSTSYSIERRYLIPPAFMRTEDKNVIAVRVYDDGLAGGIVHGDIGIFYRADEISLASYLKGSWKLRTGDDVAWAAIDYDDSGWQEVAVPAYWDAFGLKEYDGPGWYRTRFRVPRDLQDGRIILFLGKIDDVDEVYLNGVKIGSTGPWPKSHYTRGYYGEHYKTFRAYFLPRHLIQPGGENVLAVRVFDTLFHGGIWDGPVGLVRRDEYLRWERRQSSVQSFIDWLLGR